MHQLVRRSPRILNPVVFDTFEVTCKVDEEIQSSPRQTILFQQRDFGFPRFVKLLDINTFCEEVVALGYSLCREDTIKAQFTRYQPLGAQELFFCPLVPETAAADICKTTSLTSGKDTHGTITKWLSDFPWSEALLQHLSFENSGWLFENLQDK